MEHRVFFNLHIDCEATQRSVADAGLGERAIRGLGDLLARTGTRATFQVIPSDLRVHSAIYRELEAAGHEIGLHLHPAEEGYQEYLGVHSREEQRTMIGAAAEQFAERMGYRPRCFTPGYCSANDSTFAVLEELGFSHGMVSLPTRDLPECASVWGRAPLEVHYPHRYNRCLAGDVDFVEIPPTLDPASRLWGGAHPQDLRVELVDAKNHWYTVRKSLEGQLGVSQSIPVKHLVALTHNTFDYDAPQDFRRQTLLGIVSAARELCSECGAAFVPATAAEIAAEYRRLVPLPRQAPALSLDTRGRSFLKARI